MEECFRAKIYEDQNHRWSFWDFITLRYLPSRGIAFRSNKWLDANLQWLVESALWRVYRGDYRDPSFGTIEPNARACVCVSPLDGDELLFDEWKVLSEHNTVAEAYCRLDDLLKNGTLQQDINARQFQFSVVDQFGTELSRPA
jgi:hypothetical protein